MEKEINPRAQKIDMTLKKVRSSVRKGRGGSRPIPKRAGEPRHGRCSGTGHGERQCCSAFVVCACGKMGVGAAITYANFSVLSLVFPLFRVYNEKQKKIAGRQRMDRPGIEKTNVMRILDGRKIPYIPHTYPVHEDGTAPSGTEIAAFLGKDTSAVWKTLVTRGASGRIHIFDIPSDAELDLKKAAQAVREKSVEMLKAKELLPTVGYVHGGCSPVGMKKPFPVTFDAAVATLDTVTISAGKVGAQVEISPADLLRIVPYTTAEITK